MVININNDNANDLCSTIFTMRIEKELRIHEFMLENKNSIKL